MALLRGGGRSNLLATALCSAVAIALALLMRPWRRRLLNAFIQASPPREEKPNAAAVTAVVAERPTTVAKPRKRPAEVVIHTPTPAAASRPAPPLALTRGRSSRGSLRTADDRKMLQIAPFSPALAHWELAQKSPEALQQPSAWEFDAALLFVDISGFTNLCTRLDIDALQQARAAA